VYITVDAITRLVMMKELSDIELEDYATQIAKTAYDVECPECNAGKGMYCRVRVPQSRDKSKETWTLTQKVHMQRIESAIRMFLQAIKNR
jgi:hypothetical protein